MPDHELTNRPPGWYLCELVGDRLARTYPMHWPGSGDKLTAGLAADEELGQDDGYGVERFTNFRPLIELTPDLVRVKSLVWVKDEDGNFDSKSLCGHYRVALGYRTVNSELVNDQWRAYTRGEADWCAEADSAAAAKRAAEEHYRERLNAAVEKAG